MTTLKKTKLLWSALCATMTNWSLWRGLANILLSAWKRRRKKFPWASFRGLITQNGLQIPWKRKRSRWIWGFRSGEYEGLGSVCCNTVFQKSTTFRRNTSSGWSKPNKEPERTASCWFLDWITLRNWRLRQYFSPKANYTALQQTTVLFETGYILTYRITTKFSLSEIF